MVAGLHVGGEMARHRVLVFRHDNSARAFRPEQQLGIPGPQRQAGRLADAGGVNWKQAERVVVLNGIP